MSIFIGTTQFALQSYEEHYGTVLGARQFYRLWGLLKAYEAIEGEAFTNQECDQRNRMLTHVFMHTTMNTLAKVEGRILDDMPVAYAFLDTFQDTMNSGYDHLQETDMRDHPLAVLIGIPEAKR